MDEGLVDTNVFVHAFMNDDRTEECVAFLDGVRSGVTRAEIHPLVVHELTYTFVRYKIFPDRYAISEYIRSVLHCPGITTDVDALERALVRWGQGSGVAFVDAYLAEIALRDNRPVYTINVRDFAPYGVNTPSPLPPVGWWRCSDGGS